MSKPTANRRHVVLAIVFVWVLVCGGLGWATRLAIKLDQREAAEAAEKLIDRKLERAISRMEAEIAPVLNTERTRPYSQFRDFYVPTPKQARYRHNGSDASREIEVASPLSEFRGPDWILLHFQASPVQGWSSPELKPGAELAMPAGAIPPRDRPTQAAADNWLSALRERYSVAALQQVLEEALAAGGSGRSVAGEDESAKDGGEPPLRSSAAEFERRGARLLQMQRESYSEYLCEPESVALENLETRGGIILADESSIGCVPTYAPVMTPVWLDVTADGELQLAMVRSASVENSAYCTLQGLLIDWPRLRSVLEEQVRDIFPHARLFPVPPHDPAAESSARGMMLTIPARLDPGETIEAAAPSLSSGLVGGLAVAWVSTLLALLAISYGTMKYVTLADRRMKFVSAVTHELRTPLTSFQLYSDLLSEMPAENPERRKRFAEILRSEAGRLARLVENVLSYSRVGDAAPKIEWRTTGPQPILTSAAAATAEACRAAGKELVVKNDCPNETALETDAEFVVQILSNLVENACKYSGALPDRRIWLSASPGPGESLTFEVEDPGPGVPARDRRAIFEPFRRGSADQAGGAGGVGLGLSLSRYWASCLGGVLMLRRGRRNGAHFSCFSLTLPSRPSRRD